MQICIEQYPETTEVSNAQKVNCWLKHPSAPEVVNPVIERRKQIERDTCRDQ